MERTLTCFSGPEDEQWLELFNLTSWQIWHIVVGRLEIIRGGVGQICYVEEDAEASLALTGSAFICCVEKC